MKRVSNKCSTEFGLAVLMALASVVAVCAQEAATMASEQVINRVSPSVVLILAGQGAGRHDADRRAV